jgi:mono/diheme cytochrome c family protein
MKRLLTASAIAAALWMSAPGLTPDARATAAPKTHTVKLGDALHAPGFATPAQKCSACHGKDLKGGAKAPSCFSCHEKKW